MEHLGKYRLLRRIGRGGMAEVYLAQTTVAQGLAKQLVIKQIHPSFARSREFQSMFVDEARIALELNHPNIVQVFDFGAHAGSFYLVMEYVEGVDILRLLGEIKRQRRRMPLGMAAHIAREVCKGLDYAHRKRDRHGQALAIVHRDISPQNILVSWSGAVKIVDFGIARTRHVHEHDGVIMGKFAYMAPEQARGEPVDARADVFSAGVVLFELASGRPLVPGTGKEILELLRRGELPAPREVAPELPDELATVIAGAVTPHPQQRYPSARAFQDALSEFLRDLAARRGELTDSTDLGQFVTDVMQPGESDTVETTGGAASTGPHGSPSVELGPVRTGVSSAELRERKYVFVVQARVCGVEAGPGPAGEPGPGGTEISGRTGAAGSAPPRWTVRGGEHAGAGGAGTAQDPAAAALGSFLRIARDIAYKHDARVHIAGTREITLVVGLPLAEEDDGTRTIRLALALQEALDAIGHDGAPGLQLAVGIQRGIAALHRDEAGRISHELAGPTVALARRLALAARGGEVLVSAAVSRVAKDDWNFAEHGPVELPAELELQLGPGGASIADPSAKVYRLTGPKERAQRLQDASWGGALFGRDLELKALRDAYRHTIVSGGKHHVVIVGERGVGKRALVRAFRAGIPQGEALVVRAVARAATSYTPFALVADMARDLLGLPEGASTDQVQHRVRAAAHMLYPGQERGSEVASLIEAVCMLLDAPLGDEPAVSCAEERRHRLLQAMQKVEQRLGGEQPLIVIGEDLHWSDSHSWELFSELMRLPSKRPVFAVVTTRPDERILRTARHTRADIIEMDELDEAARIEFVVGHFAPGEDVLPLARQLVAQAGGNALYLRELIEALLDRGVLERAAPGCDDRLRWRLRDAPLHVPASLEALIATRLDHLPPAEKSVLLHASVLGRLFTPQALYALLGRPAGEELESLARRRLLRRRGAKFAFRNDLTMTVAHKLLLPDDRVALHRSAARHLTELSRQRGHHDAVIARHLELAGDSVPAADHYLIAAEHAMRVGGNKDAFRQLSRALELLPASDHARRFAAHQQREEILSRAGRRPEQLRELHRMRREAEALSDPGKLAFAHARLTHFYIDVGKTALAARSIDPALEHARAAGDPLAEAEALRLRAILERVGGDNEAALQLSRAALALCHGDDAATLAQRAIVLNNLGTTLWSMDRLAEAIDAYAEALVIHRGLKDRRHEAYALNNMGNAFAALGEFEDALAHYKSSLKIDQEVGDTSAYPLKLGNIGQTYAELGDLERADRYLSKALAVAGELGDELAQIDVLISLSHVELARHRALRATELAGRALGLAVQRRDRYQEVRARIYLALAQLRAGDGARSALEQAETAAALASEMRMPMAQIQALVVQAWALLEQGRTGKALAASGQAVTLLESIPHTVGSEYVLHSHALLCEQTGRLPEARQLLARALADVRSKAERLRDQELRHHYLHSAVPAAVECDYARLCAAGECA